jgi:transcriptional regulator GlxA family with amidase domain
MDVITLVRYDVEITFFRHSSWKDLMPHISMVLTPGFQFLALGVQAAFELANVLKGEDYYTLSIASVEGGPVTSSSGFAVPTTPLAEVGQIDTLLLLAGLVPPPQQEDEVLERLRAMAKQSRRVAGLCTGAFCWDRWACSTGGAPQRIGPMRGRCASAFPM